MAWGKAGTNTLSGAQTNNVVTGMTASKTNQFLTHAISGVGANEVEMQFGNGSIDGLSNYAFRKSDNGGADVLSPTTTVFKLHNASSQQDKFGVGYIVNIASEEKIGIGFIVEANTAGAGVVPLRAESVGKWANTSVQFDQIEHQSGNLQSDSNLTVLGSDLTPADAITFPTNLQVGSRAEITDSRKIYNLTDDPTTEDDFSSSAGWTQVTNTASGVSNGELIGLTDSSGTNGAGAWKDYGLVSDTKFVLRCKFQIVTQSGGAGNASTLYFGISDTNGATSPHSNRDGFGIAITNYALSGMLWTYPDGATWDNADTDMSLTPTATTYYLEIARTSATSVTFKLFSDEYSTVVKTHTQTIASTLNGLRYIMFQEWRNGSTNTTKVAVDDLKIYNDTSSVSSFTPYWKEIGA